MRPLLPRLCLCAALFAGSSGCAGNGSAPRPAADLPSPGPRPVAKAYLNMPPDGNGPLPVLLSQTGAFADTCSLAPAPALIPYELNVSFWSAGATKARWVAIPNDGAGRVATVRFAPTGEWHFPPGTVFVKHFEMPIDETAPGVRQRLETRLLVCDSAGGVYGASYRWRPDGSDAELVNATRLAPVTVRTREGMRTQQWYYPGPDDCRKCHVAAAGGVLGPNTRQMNRDMTYPSGATENQLHAWNRMGLFDRAIGEAPSLARLAAADDTSRKLEDRVRSYLDVNCAYCHRPGGAAADFDARYDTPLERQLLVNVPARINLGIDRARFIAPRDVWRSMVLARVETLEPVKMPPLGHERIDRKSVELLRAWVNSLPGPPVLAPPAIAPKGGDFAAPVQVTLSHEDPGAVIRYTLDGSVPGPASPVYRGPLRVEGPATLRCRAFKDGYTKSITVQETFIVGG